MMNGDTDAVEVVTPVLAPEPVKPRRHSPSAKWDAMDIQGRLDVLNAMQQRGMLPPGAVMMDHYQTWEALDMRFGNLMYEVQEKVISYMRKNYADLD